VKSAVHPRARVPPRRRMAAVAMTENSVDPSALEVESGRCPKNARRLQTLDLKHERPFADAHRP
jgi:hypothetical protein